MDESQDEGAECARHGAMSTWSTPPDRCPKSSDPCLIAASEKRCVMSIVGSSRPDCTTSLVRRMRSALCGRGYRATHSRHCATSCSPFAAGFGASSNFFQPSIADRATASLTKLRMNGGPSPPAPAAIDCNIACPGGLILLPAWREHAEPAKSRSAPCRASAPSPPSSPSWATTRVCSPARSKSPRTIFSTASIPRKRPRAARRSKRAS